MNSKRDHDRFRAYLNSLGAIGRLVGAARQSNIHPVTARRWAEASKRAADEDDREIFWFDFHGESDFYHGHLNTLLKTMIGEIQHGIVVAARDGVWTPAYLNGLPVWLPNDDGFVETEETKKYPTDLDLWLHDLPTRWLRDENFNRIQSMIWTPPTSERQQLVLGAFTRQFARRLDVAHDHNVHGGVLVVGGKPHQAALPSVQTVDPVEATSATDGEFTEQPVEEQPEQPPQPRDLLTPMQRQLIEQAKRK